jgi:glycosyltransferase involved in cell wall biosynthesis
VFASSAVPHRPRIVILRGHQANPWELRPWEQQVIASQFDVDYLVSQRGWFDTGSLQLNHRRILTMRDLAVRIPGDRYLGLRAKLRTADIVHAQELGYWYSMQAARLRSRIGFKLVLTVWETIPFLDAYRNVRTRAYRRQTIIATDLFLAATERARTGLLLEGVPAERIRVCPPGVAVDRFGRAEPMPGLVESPLIISPGRLVWEKGHQDVLRAVAVLRRGLLDGSDDRSRNVRLSIIGTGPEERRLRAYANELGIADAVEFRGFVAYDEMPSVYAGATCLVLASLPIWSWEEQFGMVLAEAMAAGTPIIASTSGAIPEVTGSAAGHFSPGDWPTLARMLDQLIARSDAVAPARAARDASWIYSTEAAARRLAEAYDDLLAGRVA